MPGYAEAMDRAFQRQQCIRERAIFNLVEKVCGFRLKLITLRTHSALRYCQNGYVTAGRPIDFEAAAALIWMHSPRFRANSGRYHWFRIFIRIRLRVLGKKALSGIDQWVDEQYQDATDSLLPKKQKPRPPVTAESFSLIELIASNYPYSESEILDMPVARAWQYRRCLNMRTPDYHPMQETDRVDDEFRILHRRLSSTQKGESA
ncbi:MAG: hypothetical protein AAF546_00225 [Verrucomicrobiota bacterium]